MRPPHMTQCCAKNKAKEGFLAEPCFARFYLLLIIAQWYVYNDIQCGVECHFLHN